jgi:hypothetical protein
MNGEDHAMLRKCIITFAAIATLGVAALASGPASARGGHWGGGHWGGGHWGGGHWGGGHWGGHHMLAFHHPHFFVRERFAFRHPFFFRRHFALIGGPILIDDGCWRVRRVLTRWGWRWHRVWVCG